VTTAAGWGQPAQVRWMSVSLTTPPTFCNHICNSADGLCGAFHVTAPQFALLPRSHSRQVPQPYSCPERTLARSRRQGSLIGRLMAASWKPPAASCRFLSRLTAIAGRFACSARTVDSLFLSRRRYRQRRHLGERRLGCVRRNGLGNDRRGPGTREESAPSTSIDRSASASRASAWRSKCLVQRFKATPLVASSAS
jgi:hypothetical protein